MKKIVNLFMVMLVLMMVTACGSDERVVQEEVTEQVVASENDSEADIENNQANMENSQEVTSDSVSAGEETSDSVSVPEDEIPEESESALAEPSEDEEFAKELAEMRIYEEEGVRDNALFAGFLDGEVTALTYETNEAWYCSDYYKDASEKYHKLYGVQIFSGDVNGDSAKELLLLIYHTPSDGNLFVFHEENGTLKAWEVFEDFMWHRYGCYYLHENGMIHGHSGYGVGRSFYKYSDAGELQTLLWDYYTSTDIEGGDRYDNTLYIYENNVLVRQLDTAYTMEDGSDVITYVVGSEELQAEINSIVKEMKESSPVLREIHMAQWED